MTKRILLVDADVVAYQCAARLEHASEWHPGFWTWHVNFDHVCDAVDSTIISMKEKLEADDVRLCLTDPHHNFRKDVLPSYKIARSAVRRPLVLMHVKDWLVEERKGIMVPGLEGDDVLGILATRPSKHEQIIVSLDKDLKTIPGKYVRTRAVVNDEGAEIVGAWDITEITEDEADRYFLKQTLSGDVTDGYTGCPGIGEGTASKIIDGGLKKVAYEHILQRGKRKGETETRYEEVPTDDLWEVVLSHYAAAGLGEEEALVQARCARILRASDYDLKKKKVKLWKPS
jgi:DNA polymerase-1